MGRPKGAVSMKTLAAQRFCRSVCDDPEYRESILRRARAGTLGSMESQIWWYAYGRPKLEFSVELSADEDLSSLSMEELKARHDELNKQIEEAAALRTALAAEFTVVK